MPDSTPRDGRTTLLELLRSTNPWLGQSEADAPWWPPDVFAMTSVVLRRTGSYVRAIELPHKSRQQLLSNSWPEEAVNLAQRWLHSLNQFVEQNEQALWFEPSAGRRIAGVHLVAPEEVRGWWKLLIDQATTPIADIALQDASLTRSIIALSCVADEACRGVGTRHKSSDSFAGFADWVLSRNGLRTLCIDVPHDRVAVLPKQHTPQRGLTLRSLSHNLSLHPATEVVPLWRTPVSTSHKSFELMNILLLPWPTQVSAADFRLLSPSDSGIPRVPALSRFFDYEPVNNRTPRQFSAQLMKALAGARKHATQIHAIVLPELALSIAEFEEAEKLAIREGLLLMAGVRVRDGEFDRPRGYNACWFQTGGLLVQGQKKPKANTIEAIRSAMRVTQGKHHRWCLDRGQILQYGLGGRLPASKDCWELSDIAERVVEFFTIDSWLTWAVLICEDLARQDPVAEVIRAVGPNMLVALLMDGPQTRDRWSARYASVLAEDPGCSVLTLTSLGMSRRTRGNHQGTDRSNVVALWRDAYYGAREIELEEDHDSCVLSLVCKTIVEYTADGRDDRGSAHYPVFAGAHSFRS